MSVALVNNWKASVTLLLVITIKGPARGTWGVFSPPPTHTHRNLGIHKRKRKGKAQPFPKQQIRTSVLSVYSYLLAVKNNLIAENQFEKILICAFRNLLLDSMSKKLLEPIVYWTEWPQKALKSARNWKGRGSIICSVHLSHIGI